MTSNEQDQMLTQARINAFEQVSLNALAEQGALLSRVLSIMEKMVDAFADSQKVGYLTVTPREEMKR